MSTDYLIRCYKEYFKRILLPLGFKLKGQGFYRVVNGEVIQAVRIQRHRMRRSFTINFDFTVTCIGGDIEFLAKEDIRLPMFLYGDDIWWDYNNNDDGSIEHIVNHVANEFKKVLYLFLNSIDIQSYHEIKCDIEKKAYGNIIKSMGKIMVCLKLKRYNEALMYIEHIERYSNEWLKEQLDICKDKNEELKFIKMAEEDLREYVDIKDAILRKDISFINEVINKNEYISKQSCRNYLNIVI